MFTEITNSVIETYEHEGVLCPSKLRRELFTTAAVDNIDHNPSSTTSQSSFRGTAIFFLQHPCNSELGTPRDTDVFDPSEPSTSKTISHFLSSYSEVTPKALPTGDFNAPGVPQQLLTSCVSLSDESGYDEEDWLSNTQELVTKEKQTSSQRLSIVGGIKSFSILTGRCL